MTMTEMITSIFRRKNDKYSIKDICMFLARNDDMMREYFSADQDIDMSSWYAKKNNQYNFFYSSIKRYIKYLMDSDYENNRRNSFIKYTADNFRRKLWYTKYLLEQHDEQKHGEVFLLNVNAIFSFLDYAPTFFPGEGFNKMKKKNKNVVMAYKQMYRYMSIVAKIFDNDINKMVEIFVHILKINYDIIPTEEDKEYVNSDKLIALLKEFVQTGYNVDNVPAHIVAEMVFPMALESRGGSLLSVGYIDSSEEIVDSYYCFLDYHNKVPVM